MSFEIAYQSNSFLALTETIGIGILLDIIKVHYSLNYYYFSMRLVFSSNV